jgi:hypothetical protein
LEREKEFEDFIFYATLAKDQNQQTQQRGFAGLKPEMVEHIAQEELEGKSLKQLLTELDMRHY